MNHPVNCTCTACGHCLECADGTAGPSGTYCLACHRTQRPGNLTNVPCEVCGRLTFAGRICCTPR